MTSEKNEENSRELERSDIHIASSIDEEERQHLNSLNRTTKYEDAFKCSNSEAFSKKDVIYSFDNKINPFNLSSSNDRVEKIVNINI